MSDTLPLDKQIGKGQYGSVYSKCVAYKNQKWSETSLEIAVLSQISVDKHLNYFISIDPDSHFIIMRMLVPYIDEYDTMQMYKHVKLALGLLHIKYQIAHCDVNYRNIMFDPKENVFKLVDYGASLFLSHFDGNQDSLPIVFEDGTIPSNIFVKYKDLRLVDFGQLLCIVFESYDKSVFERNACFEPPEYIPKELKAEILPYMEDGEVQIQEMYMTEIALLQYSPPCQIDICEIINQCPHMVRFVTHLTQFTLILNMMKSDPYRLCIACDWYGLLWKYFSHKILNESMNVMVATCMYIAYYTNGYAHMFESLFGCTDVIHKETKDMLISVLNILKDAFPRECAYKVHYKTRPTNWREFIKFYTKKE